VSRGERSVAANVGLRTNRDMFRCDDFPLPVRRCFRWEDSSASSQGATVAPGHGSPCDRACCRCSESLRHVDPRPVFGEARFCRGCHGLGARRRLRHRAHRCGRAADHCSTRYRRSATIFTT
jgi:hypothetical protein